MLLGVYGPNRRNSASQFCVRMFPYFPLSVLAQRELNFWFVSIKPLHTSRSICPECHKKVKADLAKMKEEKLAKS